MIELIAIAAGAYLIGSIPWGALLSRQRGVDIRKVGSGNIGATNVARALGKRMGIVVLLLDALKGAGPVLLARAGVFGDVDPRWLLGIVTCAPVIGHCFPVWLRFRGGKGVATALGVFLAIDPVATAACFAVFIVVYALFHVASLASMLASLTMAPALWWLDHDMLTVWIALGIALLIVTRHHQNIRRLLSRTELKV